MRLLLCLVLLAGMFATSAGAADAVGFRRLRIDDPARPLDVAIWYPTEARGNATLIGDNAVFVGEPVQENAPPTAGRHRLVVLSHGYSGNWTNQVWLAVALVQRRLCRRRAEPSRHHQSRHGQGAGRCLRRARATSPASSTS